MDWTSEGFIGPVRRYHWPVPLLLPDGGARSATSRGSSDHEACSLLLMQAMLRIPMLGHRGPSPSPESTWKQQYSVRMMDLIQPAGPWPECIVFSNSCSRAVDTDPEYSCTQPSGTKHEARRTPIPKPIQSRQLPSNAIVVVQFGCCALEPMRRCAVGPLPR